MQYKTSRTSVKCKTRFRRFYSVNGPPPPPHPPKKENPDYIIRENQESWAFKSGIQLNDSGILQTIGIRNPLIQVSVTMNRESSSWKKNLVVIRQWKQTVYLRREQLVHLQVILLRLAADQWLLSESSQAHLKCLLKRLKNKNNTND